MEVRSQPQHRQAELTVANTGPEIPPQELTHVFDRFFRGSGPRFGNGDYQGTGLGLSICQAVVNAHRGRITATSDSVAGTKFTVTLPLCDVPAASANDTPQPESLLRSG